MKTIRYKIQYEIESNITNNYKGYIGNRVATNEDIETLKAEGYKVTIIKQLGRR